MTKPKIIVTHGGMYHADEVVAIELIRYAFHDQHIPVERTFKVSDEHLNDTQVWVLDVGRVYNPLLKNFDHHQSSELPATNILILDTLIHHGLICHKVGEKLGKNFFNHVSNVDLGVKNKESGVPCVNSIIASMNGSLSFDEACKAMRSILKGQISTAIMAVKGEESWNDLIKKQGKNGYLINEDKGIIPGWKNLAEKDGVKFLITPNARVEGHYQAITRDEIKYPIGKAEGQNFIHNAKFMAVYDSYEKCLTHVKAMCNK
ncbi:MAG: MYG1 family protein [Saprospiraceae bacterium]|nr:MYG1 family protein [Saprospiraceae bacterium]